VTIVAVENQYYIIRVCVCSLRYLAFNAHALYRHLWSVRLYNIFPPRDINSKIFGKIREWPKIPQEMSWLISSEYFCFHPAFTHYLLLS